MFKFFKKNPESITIRAEEVHCEDRFLYNGTMVQVEALGRNETMVYLCLVPVEQLPFTSGAIDDWFYREQFMTITR